MVIGGVNKKEGRAWTHEERLKYSKEALKAIHLQQKSLPIKGSEWLIHKAGKKKFIALNDKLRTEERLNDVEMKELAGALPGLILRWFLFPALLGAGLLLYRHSMVFSRR